MQYNSKFSRIIITEFVIYGLIVLFTILGQESTVSILFFISVLLILPLYKNGVTQNMTVSFELLKKISIGAAFCASVSSFLHGVFPEPLSYITFMVTIIYMWIMENSRIDVKTGTTILYLGIVISCFYPIGNFLFGVGEGKYGFQMGFSNPNLTGMFILNAIIYCTVGLVVCKKYIIRGVVVILMYLNYSLLIKTEARNCMIALALMILLITYLLLTKKVILPKWALITISILPIIFIIIYINYVSMMGSLLGEDVLLNHEGKSVDSRLKIWTFTFKELSGYYLIGNYSVLSGNAHNSHLTVLASYGIFVLWYFIKFLYEILKNINQGAFCIEQKICLCAFVCMLFMGIGEGALFCGSIGLFIPSCTYIALAKVNWRL